MEKTPKCRELRLHLLAYEAGHLVDSGLNQAIFEHLGRCQRCSEEVNDLKIIRATLREVHEIQTPSTLLTGVLEKSGWAKGHLPEKWLHHTNEDIIGNFKVESPIGPVLVGYTTQGIRFIQLGSIKDFPLKITGKSSSQTFSNTRPPKGLANRISARLHGKEIEVPVDLSGLTVFARKVLSKTLEIPRGEVRSYAWIAREIGHEGAVRAVGSVLAKNPLPILIPCHRVVRTGGNLGQYRFGAEKKRQLLNQEGIHLEKLEQLGKLGIKFMGSDTTKVFCLPICRYASQIDDRHRVAFHNAKEAAASGYRPCKVCRPAPLP